VRNIPVPDEPDVGAVVNDVKNARHKLAIRIVSKKVLPSIAVERGDY
jgi:hypothetical protein